MLIWGRRALFHSIFFFWHFNKIIYFYWELNMLLLLLLLERTHRKKWLLWNGWSRFFLDFGDVWSQPDIRLFNSFFLGFNSIFNSFFCLFLYELFKIHCKEKRIKKVPDLPDKVGDIENILIFFLLRSWIQKRKSMLKMCE